MRVLIVLAAFAVVSIIAGEFEEETVLTSPHPPRMALSRRSAEKRTSSSKENVGSKGTNKSVEKPPSKQLEPVEKPVTNEANKSPEKLSSPQNKSVEKPEIKEANKSAPVSSKEQAVPTETTPEEELEQEKAQQEKEAKEEGDVSQTKSETDDKTPPKEISGEAQPDALEETEPVKHMQDAHNDKHDSRPAEESKISDKLPAPAELKEELQNKDAPAEAGEKLIEPEATPIVNSAEKKV